MKTAFNQWLRENVDFRGLLGCGLRHTDKSCFSQTNTSELSTATLDKGWRNLAETMQCLQQQRLGANRLRWVFDRGVIHAAARPDGTQLGVITAKGEAEVDAVALERVINDFLEMQV